MTAAAVLSPTNLPSTSYGVTEDTTTFTEATQSVSKVSSDLLISRISSVLESSGYKDDSIDKVAERVNANIVHGKIDLEELSIDTLQGIGELLDTDLLNREKLRSRNVYLNSNEPVLVLELPHDTQRSITELSQIKTDFINLLRARSIVPVRVYVREVDNLNPSQFGFCLLNVVNTDIGGPSMVQLLDAAFHGENWNRDFIIKEAFNGFDPLWRDEVVAASPGYLDFQPVATEELAVAESANIETDSMVEGVAEPVQDSVVSEPEASKHYRDVTEIPEEHEEDNNLLAEHPAMAEIRQWESSRQIIEHPSWFRGDGGDLLDIIRTQSSTIRDDEPGTVAESAKGTHSDDFELVEKL